VANNNIDNYILFYKYLEENDLLGVQLRSFEYFVDVEMIKIGRELGTFSPRLLSPGLRGFGI